MTKIERILHKEIPLKIIESASQDVVEYSLGFCRIIQTEKGEDVIVEAGDVVEVPQTFELKFREILSMIQALAYVFVAYATVRNLN